MNNKSRFILSLCLISAMLVAVAAAGCAQAPASSGAVVGSGKVISETRDVAGITSVEFSAPGYLTVTQGDAESLSIQAEDNLLPYITTTVADGVLSIDVKPGTTLQNTSMIQFTLVVKDLSSLLNTGSGYVSANGLTLTDFSFKASGSGAAKLAGITAAALTVDLTGSGTFEIAGTSDTLTLTSSGSGAFNGAALAVKDAKVDISGSGNAEVDASATLDATLSGSGSLVYTGEPKINQNITGSGTISAK